MPPTGENTSVNTNLNLVSVPLPLPHAEISPSHSLWPSMMRQVTYKSPGLQRLLRGLSVTGVSIVVAAMPEDKVTVPQVRYTGPVHSFPGRPSALSSDLSRVRCEL